MIADVSAKKGEEAKALLHRENKVLFTYLFQFKVEVDLNNKLKFICLWDWKMHHKTNLLNIYI